jgi:predicted N-acyltransferase
MLEHRVARSIADVGRERWDALFAGEVETYDYLLAIEEAGLEGFRWRYGLVVEGEQLLAAAPMFLTEYALETTVVGPGRRLAAEVRRLFPGALTLRMACLGSPCTETVLAGFAPQYPGALRAPLLANLLAGLEAEARRERCGLMGVKDVAAPDQASWDLAVRPEGFRRIPGLPVAHLEIDFPDLQTYLARLSPGARKDMRRKLRALDQVRVELREDLDGLVDRVMALYRQTRARAEMRFEDLTPAYFTGVVRRMPGRAFYALYYLGDELLAANLLLQDGETLLDKFFCMEAERGRPLNLYFLSWFTNVRLCLERGLKRYQSGQAAYANKLRLGSQLTRTSMYFRHRNAVMNGALQLVAPLFAADPTQRTAA